MGSHSPVERERARKAQRAEITATVRPSGADPSGADPSGAEINQQCEMVFCQDQSHGIFGHGKYGLCLVTLGHEPFVLLNRVSSTWNGYGVITFSERR